ncbi:CRISPR-associated endonuclease Cas1 [Nocardia salmonicida]|uniref:CRISPR-associated endonuclease Cas1 n=1 Tax=Nocardia salmonicida TaxID=53431 RepID=UPI0037AE887F
MPESVARFHQDAEANVAQIRCELLDGSYRPSHLHEILIPKADGSFRELAIPRVRDRIVERSVLAAITAHVDPWLGAASYAYRPGLGVADAVQAVVRLREEGLGWVLRADVRDCFSTIPRDHALRLLTTALPDDTLNPLLSMLTGRRVITRAGVRDLAGLPQGTSLSPLMSNLVLVGLDNALLDRGFAVVRFADDFAVVCESADDAWEAARTASTALEETGMNLATEKTQVMSFDEGFSFLGEDFGPRYPPVIDEHRVREPTRKVVYVALQGSRIYTGKGRLTVESRDDEPVLDVPISHVARIVCFGSVGVSAGVRAWAFDRDVEVVFLSRRGTYLGQMLAASSRTRTARIRAQARMIEQTPRVLQFGRAVVEAKIRHQVTVVQRFGRREHADDIADPLGQMRAMQRMLPMAESTAEVMGVEGAAARNYFAALAQILPDELGFGGRSRRPPMDVVNSALSYGYAVLLTECVSALVAAGLDPAFGMLHAEDDQRPSLALDLMEEFRPMIVDQIVLAAARRGSLTAAHGVRRESESGVWLTKAGKQVLTDGYERRMLQVTSGALTGFSDSLRRHLYRQAERLAAFINDENHPWSGLSWR